MGARTLVAVLLALLAVARVSCAEPATALRADINGWIVVQVSGAPYERGYAFGLVTGAEYAASYEAMSYFTLQTIGMDMTYFESLAVELHAQHVPLELQQEMEGIAAGLTAGGAGRNVSYSEILGWNSWLELTGYYWPTVAPVAGQRTPRLAGHCSAFAAVGSATADGRITIGHTTFMDFIQGQAFNVLLDLTPEAGHRFAMQTAPGLVASMTDFFVTAAGLIVTETTIVNFAGYNASGVPEWIRARNATQYSTSIAEWTASFAAGNNGGYANSWLLGDVKTNEIAEFELGLQYSQLTVITDGTLYGDNLANSPQIRNLECADVAYSDVRSSTGSRRVRWPQLLDEYYGNISVSTGQAMLADTFDPYTLTNNPSSRTICAHFDADPQSWASDPNLFEVPFLPMGSVDAKLVDSAMLEQGAIGLALRFGRADGVAFDAQSFFAAHPQWAWQADYVQSRPTQPYWTYDG